MLQLMERCFFGRLTLRKFSKQVGGTSQHHYHIQKDKKWLDWQKSAPFEGFEFPMENTVPQEV